jgi:predicted nucleotidyltransferase
MTVHSPARRDDILKVLRENRRVLNGFGVASLSLFGSFARDEGREDSDVDLLVEFSRPIGLFEFVRLQRQLGELLGHQVDLVTPAALKPQLRDRIMREAVVAA